MSKRVVVTGLGVVSSIGIGIEPFLESIKSGKSGLKYKPEYEELKFGCQVSGNPDFDWSSLEEYLSDVTLYGLKSESIAYALKAAFDAWKDAGNAVNNEEVDWETGCIIGSSVSDSYIIKNTIQTVDAGNARKLGSRVVEQVMNSGATAYITGILGLGNISMSNSVACATGTQSIILGYEQIMMGNAKRMLVGSTEFMDPYIFGSFDSMRILPRKYNDNPTAASRPMSEDAAGFVPGSGAGALVLEDLDFALARGAKIYAEIIGTSNNSGGQRNGGSMTAPSPEGIKRCIQDAVRKAKINPEDIDLISGHLTATRADAMEVKNWKEALNLSKENFPLINSTKSMIGHCLSAAGSIESIGTILQIYYNFVHPTINLEHPNEQIVDMIGLEKMPNKLIEQEVNLAAKANFGFGDINTCIIFSKYN